MQPAVLIPVILIGSATIGVVGLKETPPRHDQSLASNRSFLEFKNFKETPIAHGGFIPDHGALPSGREIAKVNVFSVPTATRCIVVITIAYMAVLATLAIIRTYHELMRYPKGVLDASLRAALQTLTYGPMICVLFIAYRMRVDSLSDGHGQPQLWAQKCMYGVVIALLGSTLSVLLIPLIFGKVMPVIPGTYVLAPTGLLLSMLDGVKIATCTLRYLVLFGLYVCLAGVLLGICFYRPTDEVEVWQLPKPEPAVMCTMIIAVIFFITQLVIAICRSITEFTGYDTALLAGMMHAGSSTVEFGPMLCILCVAAQMRASEHDGQPQEWAIFCMYVATATLGLTTLFSFLVPVALGGVMTVDLKTRHAKFVVPNRLLGLTLIAARYVAMLGFYGGSVGVAASMFLFEAPAGPEHTRPTSSTIQCVMGLAVQFFALYSIQMIVITFSELSEGILPIETCGCFAAMEAAKGTVQIAPMLAILFLTTRTYALLIADKKDGAPQRWVQDSMYLSTWSLFLTCLASALTFGKVFQDSEGNITNVISRNPIAVGLVVIRYFFMLMLYGSIAATIIGLFVMAPETATGQASTFAFLNAVHAGKGFLF